MLKNIANMLGQGNLTARERYLLLIHNDIQKMKTGKGALSEADVVALENTHCTTNEEARAWNQLNDGWKLSGRMNLEAELYFKDAQTAHLAQLPIIVDLLHYPADRRVGFAVDVLKNIKKVTIDEAVAITQKQRAVKLKDGLDFDYALYRLAFEVLDEQDRKSLNELYPDVETDHQYLDQEEIIAHLYKGKAELSEEAKDKLAELVAEQSYNKFAKEYQIFHYFACIPLIEVAKFFLKIHDIKLPGQKTTENQEQPDEDEDDYDEILKTMQEYAEGHGTNIKTMLRQGCRKWLDGDLIETYRPLVASNHTELLKRWFKAKVKAKELLLEHISRGELSVRERSDAETRQEKLYSKGITEGEFAAAQKFFEGCGLKSFPKGELDEKRAFETFDDQVITGESLYAFKGGYKFIDEFKNRVNNYDANLGLVYADSDAERKGENLDQEMLICDKTAKGEAVVFSRYGMSMRMLSNILKSRMIFKEEKKDGIIVLKFDSPEIAKIFSERRQAVIDGYARLLAFERVFKKLSPIYETDMADHVTERLIAMREHLEQINQALRTATNSDPELQKTKHKFFLEKEPMRFEEDLLIDIDGIKADAKILEEYAGKVKAVFPEVSVDLGQG